jgi:SAM-dependent methyltransferase
VARTLDLGCGAGAVALLLARASRNVVATDVSARALAWTRFNALLNGVANIEPREGDLYEPVHGERFDCIAVHPPFVARPAGAAASAFIHGGARGDELPLRVVAGAAPHLSPGGRAVVLGDWPVVDGDALDARIRAAVGAGPVDVLVLQSPSKNLDEYCTVLAAVEHRDLGDAFARAAIAQREHLERMGLRGLALAFVVLAPGAGWTSLVSIRHLSDAPVTSATIERLVAARTLATGPREVLARARLRVPAGTRMVEQPMPDGGPPSVIVQLPAGRSEWPPVLEAHIGALVARISATERVGDDEQTIQAARDALLRGALELA